MFASSCLTGWESTPLAALWDAGVASAAMVLLHYLLYKGLQFALQNWDKKRFGEFEDEIHSEVILSVVGCCLHSGLGRGLMTKPVVAGRCTDFVGPEVEEMGYVEVRALWY